MRPSLLHMMTGRPKSEVYTPKRDKEHPRAFHMQVPWHSAFFCAFRDLPRKLYSHKWFSGRTCISRKSENPEKNLSQQKENQQQTSWEPTGPHWWEASAIKFFLISTTPGCINESGSDTMVWSCEQRWLVAVALNHGQPARSAKEGSAISLLGK